MRMRWHMKYLPRPVDYRTIRCQGHYKDILAGEYFVDLLINDMLLVELKTVKDWTTHTCPGRLSRGANAIHQLSESDPPLTGLQLRLLPNFGKPRLEIKRAVRPKNRALSSRHRQFRLIRLTARSSRHPRESGDPALDRRFRGDDGRVRTFATWYYLRALVRPRRARSPCGCKSHPGNGRLAR